MRESSEALVVRTPQHDHVGDRLVSRCRIKPEGSVRTQPARRAILGLRIREALPVAAQQCQMFVAVESRPRPVFRGGGPELNADGQLHDRAVGQFPNDALSEELVVRPEIAEASATLQEHGSAWRQPALKRPPRIRELIGHVGGGTAEAAEHGNRPKPDRGVAHVRVAGEVEERHGPALRDGARDRCVERGPEIRHRRWSPAHRGIRLGHGQ
jgi:hypothetical protein